MPPKKSKVSMPAIPSLQGCAITLGANSIPKDTLNGQDLSYVKAQIAKNGGTYVTKVDDATHIVLTQIQFNGTGQKVADAKATGHIHIVSYDWLQTAFSAKGPVDEKNHSLLQQSTKATSDGAGKSDRSNGIPSVDPDTNTTSKKRKRDTNSSKDPSTDSKPPGGSPKVANVTKKLDLKIPLDEELESMHGSSFVVHIDDDSVIFDVTLNQSDSADNANKFYRMQLCRRGMTSSWCTWTRWGRVGERGQTKMVCDGATLDQAMAEFKKKFKDKTGNAWEERSTGPMRAKKYVFVERSYDDSDSDSEGEDKLPGADKRKNRGKNGDDDNNKQELDMVEIKSELPDAVQNFLKLIFNKDLFDQTFDAFSYDAKKMPLGKLSKSSLLRGYEVLKALAALVTSNGDYDEIEILSNQYLSLIPHVVSRSSRPPVLDHMNKIKNEIELIEALTDMQLANDMMKNAKKQSAEEVNVLDRQFQGLGMKEMEPVERKSTEFRELEHYLTKSVGHTHGTRYKVQDIFRIERNGEHDRFNESQYAKVKNKNRRLLWHGSRVTNFGGICSQGLRIAPPEAPVSGYMFGKGVYLADMSSKSAGYTASHSSGGTGLLLLCEAELGEPPLKLTNADYNAGDRAKAEKCFSTWGVGQTAPCGWKDAGCIHPNLKGVNMPDVVSQAPGATGENGAYLQYNEYIVYDVAQIKLRYLLRVQM